MEPTEHRAIEREGAQLLESEIVRLPSPGVFKKSLAVLWCWDTSCLCVVGMLQVVPWVAWRPPLEHIRVPGPEPVNGALLRTEVCQCDQAKGLEVRLVWGAQREGWGVCP